MRVLLDEDRAAEFLGATPKTLRTWRYRKVGPPWIKVVAGVRYDLGALERWLDANTVTPQGAA